MPLYSYTQAFLRGWFAERGVSDMHSLAHGVRRRSATEGNEKFIRAERTDMRERLLVAARAGHLRWTDARVGQFVLSPVAPGSVDLMSTDGE